MKLHFIGYVELVLKGEDLGKDAKIQVCLEEIAASWQDAQYHIRHRAIKIAKACGAEIESVETDKHGESCFDRECYEKNHGEPFDA